MCEFCAYVHMLMCVHMGSPFNMHSYNCACRRCNTTSYIKIIVHFKKRSLIDPNFYN